MAPAGTKTLLVITVALVMLWTHVAAVTTTSNPSTPSTIATPSEERVGEQRRAERLLAFYTTTSVKLLATTTISVPFTCLSTNPGSEPCNGRRKRALWNDMEVLQEISDVDPLDGSEGGQSAMEEEVGEREGRRLTIWSTVQSTLTLTSTSYLAGTTITATAFCLTAGIAQGCFG
ncbi:uncharacterized protein LOC123512879 [Portunus trituberculatus]|uniref:uncharacterized protein LOC123512879 n=1 Tax=Portunus trituberculatus TaxID=210409 RepID=UPI001E1CEC1D|nr:uncharacterized protein LOC123512879 [Portunus trituberculatus]